MRKPRTTMREARKRISRTLRAGDVLTIGGNYTLRGFIVGVPKHDSWNSTGRTKALRKAKANFLTAWKHEARKAGFIA